MFIPVSIDQFVQFHLEANPGADVNAVRVAVAEAVSAKENGAKCFGCGGPIWAAGSAVAGHHGCFTCITSEADDSEDFEIDTVCR